MTSKEIVTRAIEFNNPPRIPYNFDANRTPDNDEKYGEDFVWVFAEEKEIITEKGYLDEWGCEWERLSDNTFGEPKHFVLEGHEDLSGFHMPDFTEEWRYKNLRQQMRNHQDKFILGMLPHGLFQIMLHLFGFMDFMMNVGANPQIVENLCDLLLESAVNVVDRMNGVNGIMLIDDTALQDRPMISMQDFDKIFKPRYEKLFQYCHQKGIKTFVHSCGYTYDIIHSLIDAGLDVINLDQQDNMGIDRLSKRYKGKICFFCPLDVQTTIDMDDLQLVEKTHEMIYAFSSKSGGLIAKTYPQPKAIGITNHYMKVFTDAVKKFCYPDD